MIEQELKRLVILQGKIQIFTFTFGRSITSDDYKALWIKLKIIHLTICIAAN